MKRNHKIAIIITLVVALLLIVGGTYATLNFDALIQGNKENKISSCNLSLNFKDENAISLLEAYPISDDKVSSYQPYKFTITNNSTCDTAYYKITLGDICTTCTKTDNICTINGQQLNCSDTYKIPSRRIKYELINKANGEIKKGTNAEELALTGSLSKGEAIKFELKLWIDKATSNKDLYVYENGKPKENADGSIVTKNAGYKINVEGKDTEFVLPQPTGADTIIAKVGTGGLVEDLHPDTEQLNATAAYRYTGLNPDNYVVFNNELWRIIGVFEVDNGTGKLEKRIKLIAFQSIINESKEYRIPWAIASREQYLPWSTNPDAKYPNDWTQATSMNLLNTGDYWNRTGSYASTGLTDEAKKMIGDAKWYLGAVSREKLKYEYLNNIPKDFYYKYERGTEVYNDKNPTSWIGKVGLIYPSDYGYATSGGESMNRDKCLSIDLRNWLNFDECFKNDWLYFGNIIPSEGPRYWSINTFYTETDSYEAFYFESGGYIHTTVVDDDSLLIWPSLYLSPNIKITGGTGTETDPYQLSL